MLAFIPVTYFPFRALRRYTAAKQPCLLPLVQCTADMQSPKAARRSAHYQPNMWSNDYIQSLTVESPLKVEEKDQTTRMMLLKERIAEVICEKKEAEEQLRLIDHLQQLGVAYHFKDDIKGSLRNLHSSLEEISSTFKDNLHASALLFRLLRENGFSISEGQSGGARTEGGRKVAMDDAPRQPKKKPHAVCIPYPAQGHVTPMMKLAKLLRFYGFRITFVNTHFNHKRLLRSGAVVPSDAVDLGFRFESIPDGLPPSETDATQDVPSLLHSISKHALQPFLDLLRRLNADDGDAPPVSCIISDGSMSFTLDAARELRVPEVVFRTSSACGFLGYLHYQHLIDRALTPFKHESDITNGHLDTPVDWVPGMKNMRLRDFPSFIRTTDRDDLMLNYCNRQAQRAALAQAVIFNTFDELEGPVLEAMAAILPPIYTVGPLSLLLQHHQIPDALASLGSSLWKEDRGCLDWLDGHAPASVVYVNFGSITVMSHEQLVELAWGLAGSEYEFLWVIRPDLVRGHAAALPAEFLDKTRERGMLASWCPQEAVLGHDAVGCFLTHSGWNSTLESIVGGVAMLSWPFFSEQPTNCRYACTEWGNGMEIDNNVKREDVEGLIRELMGNGEKGREMRRRAAGWKEAADKAARPGGSSFLNLARLVGLLRNF